MICHKLLVVVVLFCVFVSGDAEVRCIEREREALLSFKNGLIDEFGMLSSWRRSDECCKWYGVVCSNTSTTAHVIKLQLHAGGTDSYRTRLRGKVGSSLLELHHLNYLDLSSNYFVGNPIPESIGSMKQLRHLNLSDSNFGGIIPPQIGNLTYLRSLDLSFSGFGGGKPIPEFIGSMKQLRHLFLRSSNFSGIVPPQIGNLTNLHSLDLSRNDFGGKPIPEFIGSMKQLRHLFLGYSNFSGIVPPQIGNLTNLRSLDLSSYSLSSENFGSWLSNLSLLSFLDLSRIDLSHTNRVQHILSLHSLRQLNLEFCNISDIKPSSSSSLSILDISGNHLTRFDWLSNISTSLVKLDLSWNAMGGSIPNALLRLIRIEHLDLSYNMLEGEIPKSLGNLNRLRVLVLYKNDLRGHLDELFEILSANGILGSLQILDLADNKFSGSLPDNIGTFSSLTKLFLGGNNFSGSMPLSLGQLSELRVLDLYNNSLEGTVSESHFMKLDRLKALDLSLNSFIFDIAPDWSPPFQLDRILLAGCNVGPSFPNWIQTQRNFSYLDLSRAGIITDEVPTWLWSASPLLNNLILSHNQISGTIPNLSTTSISYIDLSYNNFSGPIPLLNDYARAIQLSGNMLSGSISSLCKIQHDRLEVLDLSNNQLAEEVPNCWEKMPRMYSLNLANNSFSGEIPRSLGSLHRLNALQLRGNNLSGELPSTLRFCQGLELIDVGGNELTGEIPSWIGNLYEMQFLNLGRNRLHGSIPLGICNLTNIYIMDFSINNLSGKIPDCFNNFTALAHKIPGRTFWSYDYVFDFYEDRLYKITTMNYGYSSFQWKGQEWEYREKNLELLKLIDFSSNRLTGNIPQSFSSMKELISLNLSRNSLTRNIIPDIGDMGMLESLDLSRNQLSGKIPTSLARLHYLAFLELSNNNLSGKIPSSTQLQSFNASRYAGNDGLCGDPLPMCPRDILTPPIPTNQGDNMNEKDDIFSFMQEVGISMGFGFIFGFWGVVGSLILKKSWRIAYFNLFDDAKDWFYVRTTLFVSKWRPS